MWGGKGVTMVEQQYQNRQERRKALRASKKHSNATQSAAMSESNSETPAVPPATSDAWTMLQMHQALCADPTSKKCWGCKTYPIMFKGKILCPRCERPLAMFVSYRSLMPLWSSMLGKHGLSLRGYHLEDYFAFTKGYTGWDEWHHDEEEKTGEKNRRAGVHVYEPDDGIDCTRRD